MRGWDRMTGSSGTRSPSATSSPRCGDAGSGRFIDRTCRDDVERPRASLIVSRCGMLAGGVNIPIDSATLAGFARANFAAHGRGAVVVEEGGAVRTLDGERYGTTLAYLYEASALFEQVGRRWPGRTKAAVD